MKIGFFEIEGWEEASIKSAFPNEELSLSAEKIDEDALPEQNDFEVLSVFVNSRITPKTLGHFPNLKYLVTRSTGYDHIDREECRKRGIAVAYIPGYGDNTVAEYAFGLLLSLTRKIYQSIDQIKETGSFSLAGLRGTDLKGKTIGIIGTGRIGKEAARIAKGFGMNIFAYDPMPDLEFAKEIGASYASLDDLLGNSDVISLHCPYSEETHHLLNRESMGKIKRGAYLVNTARGGLVETDALVEALKNGALAGAALDVLEEEGETRDELHFLASGHPKQEELRVMLENNVLMKMPNVLITPHNAFDTQEAMERILHITIENIQSFMAGKPENLVP